MSERRKAIPGSYQLHHFIMSLFCVFALVCIVTSLYSISNRITSSKGIRKRFTRSLVNDNTIDLNILKNTETPHHKSEVNDPEANTQYRSMEKHVSPRAHVSTRAENSNVWYRTVPKKPKDAHLLLPVSPSYSKTWNTSLKNTAEENVIANQNTKHSESSNFVDNSTRFLVQSQDTNTDDDTSSHVPGSYTSSGVPISVAIDNTAEKNNPTKDSTHELKNSILVKKDSRRKHEKKFVNGNIEVPEFPENYHASGLLILPHSSIAEPFEIWFAPDAHKSRIDYYYGTDKTFQRADKGSYGVAYKYVPMYNDVQRSFDGCWTLTGSKNRPIIPQIITPNITWFTYNGTEVYTGAMTTKWTYQYYAYGMRNHQTVWVTKSKPNRPIRYEMYGYDMMLGSYYDHYVLEYISFEYWNGDEEIFELPQGISCYNWTNSLSSSLIANPMQEFTAFTSDKAINSVERYEEYKAKHNKTDEASEEESKKRHHIFKHNIRYIHSHNRKNESFKLKENHFLDMTKEELNIYHGSLEKDTKKHKGIIDIVKHEKREESVTPPEEDDIPDEVDWRDFGAVTHVKGQGICGSCYAITAAGAAEGAWYRQTGKLVEVSPQQLVDCSWGYGNHGCKGGHYAAGLSWIYVHGISTDQSYGKYLGQEGYCHFNDTWFGAKIDGFSYIQPWNKTALKRAVAKYGPVAVSVNAAPLSFKFYSHGVYTDSECKPNHTHHSALVIGYGNQNGIDYWLIKNSWSNSWGENGYVKIAMDDNLCGITEYPVAVVVHHPVFRMSSKVRLTSGSDKGHQVKGKQRPQSGYSDTKKPLKSHKTDVSIGEETDLSEERPRKPKGNTTKFELGSTKPKMPVANMTPLNVSRHTTFDQSENKISKQKPHKTVDTTSNKTEINTKQEKLLLSKYKPIPSTNKVQQKTPKIAKLKSDDNYEFDDSEKPTQKKKQQKSKTSASQSTTSQSSDDNLYDDDSEKPTQEQKKQKDVKTSALQSTTSQSNDDNLDNDDSEKPTQKQKKQKDDKTSALQSTTSQSNDDNLDYDDSEKPTQKQKEQEDDKTSALQSTTSQSNDDNLDDDDSEKPTQKQKEQKDDKTTVLQSTTSQSNDDNLDDDVAEETTQKQKEQKDDETSALQSTTSQSNDDNLDDDVAEETTSKPSRVLKISKQPTTKYKSSSKNDDAGNDKSEKTTSKNSPTKYKSLKKEDQLENEEPDETTSKQASYKTPSSATNEYPTSDNGTNEYPTSDNGTKSEDDDTEDDDSEETTAVPSSPQISKKRTTKYKSRNKEDQLGELEKLRKKSSSDNDDDAELNVIKNKPVHKSHQLSFHQSVKPLANLNESEKVAQTEKNFKDANKEGEIFDLGSEQPTLPATNKSSTQSRESSSESAENWLLVRNANKLNEEVAELKKFLTNHKVTETSRDSRSDHNLAGFNTSFKFSVSTTAGPHIIPAELSKQHKNSMQEPSPPKYDKYDNYDKSQTVTSGIENDDAFAVTEKALFGMTTGAAVIEIPSLKKKNKFLDISPIHSSRVNANRVKIETTRPVKAVSRLPFMGLHITDAHMDKSESVDDIDDMESSGMNSTVSRGHTDESEIIDDNKDIEELGVKTTAKISGKVKKFSPDDLPPILKYAGNLYHQVLKDERYQANEKEKQVVLSHQKDIHHLVKNIEDAAAYLTSSDDKPTLNPENVGMYGSKNDPPPQPKRPTIMATRRQVIWRVKNDSGILYAKPIKLQDTNNSADSSLFDDENKAPKQNNKGAVSMDAIHEEEKDADASYKQIKNTKKDARMSTKFKAEPEIKNSKVYRKGLKVGEVESYVDVASPVMQLKKVKTTSKLIEHKKNEEEEEDRIKKQKQKDKSKFTVYKTEQEFKNRKPNFKAKKSHSSENRKQEFALKSHKRRTSMKVPHKSSTAGLHTVAKYSPELRAYQNILLKSGRKNANPEKYHVPINKTFGFLEKVEKDSLATLSELENDISDKKNHKSRKSSRGKKRPKQKHRKQYKMTNFEKAAKESMKDLYSRIDRMVAEKKKKDEREREKVMISRKNNSTRAQNTGQSNSVKPNNAKSYTRNDVQSHSLQRHLQNLRAPSIFQQVSHMKPQNYTQKYGTMRQFL